MNILFISKSLGRSKCMSLDVRLISVIVVAFMLVIPGLALYAGYSLGYNTMRASDLPATVWEQELEKQRERVSEATRVAEENLNALTLRLGQMQAHVIRLNALGERLTRVAGLDDGEFDFENPPAQGGPESGAGEQSDMSVPDFLGQLEGLSEQLADREQQLSVLETMLMSRNVQNEVFPAGQPVNKGWLSSRFGQRTDPFTGKLAFHKGVDIAAKEGTPILAAASGVVTWASDRYGYGNLVEINHGNGYVTRYGHNKKVLVKVGDTVKKGQVIAKMGNTGRSTGAHLHFEVYRNGRVVDPLKYIQASR